jgi:hypothetical protein
VKTNSVAVRFGSFLTLRCAVVALAVLGGRHLAFGGDSLYAAGFAPEKSEIVMGEPIYLDFNLTNTSGKRIFLSVAGIQWDLPGPFRIQAFDADGEQVPDLYGDGRFIVSTVVGDTIIEPGQVYVDRLYLPVFIKLTKPGDYTIVASRRIRVSDASLPDNLQNGGALNSRDKVNWVNTIRPIQMSPSEDNQKAISEHYQSSSITNRFKLTVLPADPERLLKCARELITEFDGIGARDPVAKPGGPRALDPEMDLNTEGATWFVGADNVALYRAVQELSDIGDKRIIPDLEKHLSDPSMKVRFACVKVLCALGEPLRAEWIVPIIKSKQWGGGDRPEQFVENHGGADAVSILIECLDMSDPSVGSLWNYRFINLIKRIGSPALDCHYNYYDDEKKAGTSQQMQENVETLNKLQDWLKAHPVHA